MPAAILAGRLLLGILGCLCVSHHPAVPPTAMLGTARHECCRRHDGADVPEIQGIFPSHADIAEYDCSMDAAVLFLYSILRPHLPEHCRWGNYSNVNLLQFAVASSSGSNVTIRCEEGGCSFSCACSCAM